MNWARRIKEYRKLAGLTQEAFAEDFGVDRTTVSRWENGRDEPALVYRKRLLSLTPTRDEGVTSGLIRFIDSLDGYATLLDKDFRVLRTTRLHQRTLGYDPADIYGHNSQRYWSADMEQIINRLGGLRGYRRNGVYMMDLVVTRHAGEGPFNSPRSLVTVGRTVAVGDPRDPVCHLTTLRLVEDEAPPATCVIQSQDGEIRFDL